MRNAWGSAITRCLVFAIWLAPAVSAHAGEPGWRTGRITNIRVLERAEGGSSVTPPVQEGDRGPGRSYGASVYLVLQSGKDTYQAQYAGPHIGDLERLRNQAVQFRIKDGKLYLKRATGQPLELQLLPAKRLPVESEVPRK